MNGLNKFLGDTIQRCVRNNISFKIYKERSRHGCRGVFDEQNLWSCSGDDWVDILVHESCHLDQFLDAPKIWNQGNDVDIWSFEDSLKSPRIWKRCWQQVCSTEINCDRRAVTKIRHYNLEKYLAHGLADYIQRSNCYHASYYYFWKYKCFYDPNKTPYDIEEIFSCFPDDRIMNRASVWKEHPILGEFLLDYNRPLR